MAATFEPFKVLDIPLKGSNLIEASAGTGKTYSIAILVLRLLLEEKIHIREVLMVTFTKAAVAELEERIRLFVREAANYADGGQIHDDSIKKIVDDAIANNDSEQVQQLLHAATLYLDEISVMTIHSFCQQTLNEFAFETKQFFSAELNLNSSETIHLETEKFWRKYVTTMPINLLNALLQAGLSKESLSALIQSHLGGKPIRNFNYGQKYEWQPAEASEKLGKAQEQAQEELQKVYEYITGNRQRLQDLCAKVKKIDQYFSSVITDCEEFIRVLIQKRDTQFVLKNLSDILEKYDDYHAQFDEEHVIGQLLHEFQCFAAQETAARVEQHRRTVNQLTFDDLIDNLHTALVRNNNEPLIEKLQKKYQAVFIDEFQDTDRQQFEIFDTAFDANTILFYIGDPKQSIYGWRKADIFTYFRAYDSVDHIYSMNVNFRSTPEMIEAMNRFFLPAPGFDTFHFKDTGQSIDYIKVEAPTNKHKGQLLENGQPVVPLLIDKNFEKVEGIEGDVASLVYDLLTNDRYRLVEKGIERRIAPSDIGILVRGNKKGAAIKQRLNQYQIPSITVSDIKVLQTVEAQHISYLLEAIAAPDRGKINRALMSIFTGYQSKKILELNAEKTIELFKGYKRIWETKGVYPAVMKFIHDFTVNNYLLDAQTPNGERIITNLYHISELLYKTAFLKNYGLPELINWLKRHLEGAQSEGDEWEQRTESDEDAVKIVTIHRSKGLQYPIVIAPELDLKGESKKERLISYKDPKTDRYLTVKLGELAGDQLDLYRRQEEQENRRLLYVAITRAVYQCVIYRNAGSHYKNTTLQKFVDEIQADGEYIDYKDPVDVAPGAIYNSSAKEREPVVLEAKHFSLDRANWGRMSYSMLAGKKDIVRTASFYGGSAAYDSFIFNELQKGATTGNLLHYLFENIHFDARESWPTVIDLAIKEFAPSKTSYAAKLPLLLENVLEAHLGDGDLQLRHVPISRRLHELEFDFPVSEFAVDELSRLSNDLDIAIRDLGSLEGIMTGFIDLFFEYNGKYYVLDWKSNYLGNRLEDYSAANVVRAMKDFNYELQYLIYTVAAKKYLKSRLRDFDYDRDFGGVIYCFLRGMRKDQSNGVFFQKPGLELIEKLEALFEKTNNYTLA